MGEIPKKYNDSATLVSDIINTSINTVAVQIIEKIAIAYVPFLGWPVISTIFHALLSKIAGLLFDQLNRVGINLVITIQTEEELNAYTKAEGKLHEANLSGDPQAIELASNEFDKAAYSLIRWDGIVR